MSQASQNTNIISFNFLEYILLLIFILVEGTGLSINGVKIPTGTGSEKSKLKKFPVSKLYFLDYYWLC